ncbi:MAG: hypothetical protein JWR19_2108 [Pedosphaera sp.]|jgi:hypothetical protein|nr:hypothetical protein [Pedosphaera sp.]
MANTQKPPIEEKSSEQLLEDLCIELRHVGVGDYGLPKDVRVIAHISEVNAIQDELNRRGVNIGPRLELLSRETNWQMPELLADCAVFPKVMPYVRELDGIRRTLRCQSCRKAERPPDAKLFWFCSECMQKLVDSLRNHVPFAGIVLLRTYTPECRCPHADDETVLATDADGDFPLYGVCEKCVLDEIERRKMISAG